MKNLVCFVSHYTKLRARRANMEAQLAWCPCPVVWITDHDREKITDEERAKYIARDFDANDAYAANAIAHLAALEAAASTSKDVLMLEDDILLGHNFWVDVETCLKGAPHDWDMIFLSEGCDLHPPNVAPGQQELYRMGTSRCASCYLVSNKCARAITANLAPIHRAIDHAYNDIIKQLGLQVFWLEPTIAREGSKCGAFQTSA